MSKNFIVDIYTKTHENHASEATNLITTSNVIVTGKLGAR